MDTLHERLADLATDAPTGGAHPAELWARGRRAHRLRSAAVAAIMLVVGAVGTGIGVRLADSTDSADPEPAGTGGIVLPIEYPVGEELPDLGAAPGPLAAIWVSPDADGGAPQVVALVAETGEFGTLAIDLSVPDEGAPFATGIALSPDGHKVAYRATTGEVVVRDVTSGVSSTPLDGIETRDGFAWYREAGMDSVAHKYRPVPLVGHVAGGTDVDGWVWQPGKEPKLVKLYDYLMGGSTLLEPYGTRDVWVKTQGGGPQSCSPPTLDSASLEQDVPQLCDVLHIVYAGDPAGLGSLRLVGHWNDPDDQNGTVVAVPLWSGTLENGHDPDERDVVVTAGAPERVTFATELIGGALDVEAGAP